MYCRYCGGEIEDDSVFCKECGRRLTKSSTLIGEECATKDGVRTKVSFKVILVIIIVIILLCLLFLLLIGVHVNNQGNDETTSGSTLEKSDQIRTSEINDYLTTYETNYTSSKTNIDNTWYEYYENGSYKSIKMEVIVEGLDPGYIYVYYDEPSEPGAIVICPAYTKSIGGGELEETAYYKVVYDSDWKEIRQERMEYGRDDATEVVTWDYDANGNVLKTIKEGDGYKYEVRNTYDEYNVLTNQIEIITSSGKSSRVEYSYTYEYDYGGLPKKSYKYASGKLVSTTELFRNSDNIICKEVITDAKNNVTYKEYERYLSDDYIYKFYKAKEITNDNSSNLEASDIKSVDNSDEIDSEYERFSIPEEYNSSEGIVCTDMAVKCSDGYIEGKCTYNGQKVHFAGKGDGYDYYYVDFVSESGEVVINALILYMKGHKGGAPSEILLWTTHDQRDSPNYGFEGENTRQENKVIITADNFENEVKLVVNDNWYDNGIFSTHFGTAGYPPESTWKYIGDAFIKDLNFEYIDYTHVEVYKVEQPDGYKEYYLVPYNEEVICPVVLYYFSSDYEPETVWQGYE